MTKARLALMVVPLVLFFAWQRSRWPASSDSGLDQECRTCVTTQACQLSEDPTWFRIGIALAGRGVLQDLKRDGAAIVVSVIQDSAADRLGIIPGNEIAAEGNNRALDAIDHIKIAVAEAEASAGVPVSLFLLGVDQVERRIQLPLASTDPHPSEAEWAMEAQFLEPLSAGEITPHVSLRLAKVKWLLGELEIGGDAAHLASSLPHSVAAEEFHCKALRSCGRFSAAEKASEVYYGRHPWSHELAVMRGEMLLANGRIYEAESLAFAALRDLPDSDRSAPPSICTDQLIGLWRDARARQSKSLESDDFLSILAKFEASNSAHEISFLRGAAFGRQMCLAEEHPANPSDFEISRGADGSLAPIELELDYEGTRIERILLDTGSPFSLLSIKAASRAGLSVMPFPTRDCASQLGSFPIRCAFASHVRVGGLELSNVPLWVGDSPVLESLGLSGILGADLMWHCRVRLNLVDYQASFYLQNRGHLEGPNLISVRSYPYIVCAADTNQQHVSCLLDTGAARSFCSRRIASILGSGKAASASRSFVVSLELNNCIEMPDVMLTRVPVGYSMPQGVEVMVGLEELLGRDLVFDLRSGSISVQ